MHWDLHDRGKSYVNLVPAKAAGTIEENKKLRGRKMKDKKIFEVRKGMEKRIF